MSISNVKNLIKKDFSLLLHPSTYVFFVIAAAMMFIPNYPRTVGVFYITLGIMNIFTLALQYKDHEACALLPVRKKESVLARVLAIVALELALLIFTIPFGILSNLTIEHVSVYMNTSTVNLTSYAVFLISYAGFNICIIPSGYHKRFKVIFPSFAGMLLFTVISLPLHLILNKYCRGMFLTATDGASLLRQLPILLGALAIFFIVNFIAYRIAARRYEKAEI